MGRSKPIYSEIRSLRRILDDIGGNGNVESSVTGGGGSGKGSGTIKQGREAYTRLLEILSDHRLRQQLGDEAIPDELYNNSNNNNDDDDDDDYDDPSTRLPHTSRKVRAKQRTALAEMWKSLITSSIQCIQQMIRNTRHRKRKVSTTTTTTSKYNEEDIRFPYKLLQLCFATDPIFDAPPSSSVTSSSYMKQQHSNKQSSGKTSTKASMTTSKPLPNLIPNKLGKEQSKLLYRYCIDLLTDIDQERQAMLLSSSETSGGRNQNNNNIDTVEDIVLSMLLYMCGRTELVSYYTSKAQIRTIVVTIVQPRIVQRLLSSNTTLLHQQQQPSQHYASSTTPQIIVSCKIWYTLYTTCSKIGIGLQYNIPESFYLFAIWCQQQLQHHDASTSSSSSSFTLLRQETMYLLNAIAVLLHTDPDLCIASLQRHGAMIVPYLQQCYRLLLPTNFTARSINSSSCTTGSTGTSTAIATALYYFLLQYMYVTLYYSCVCMFVFIYVFV
jgi:hypothetical protein